MEGPEHGVLLMSLCLCRGGTEDPEQYGGQHKCDQDRQSKRRTELVKMCVLAIVVFHLECPRGGSTTDVEREDPWRPWVVIAVGSL